MRYTHNKAYIKENKVGLQRPFNLVDESRKTGLELAINRRE